MELAAKGRVERYTHPMPKSVTTDEAFYEVMARAALDAMGLPALLERVARAERELEVTNEARTQADAMAKNDRHQAMDRTGGPSPIEWRVAKTLELASLSLRSREGCGVALPDHSLALALDRRRARTVGLLQAE